MQCSQSSSTAAAVVIADFIAVAIAEYASSVTIATV